MERASELGSPSQRLLRVGIVGHTNTGKTSVIRSLLRDHSIGDVRDEASTTRVVTPYPMHAGGRFVGEVVDTPGLEEAGALLARVRSIEMQEGVSPSTALDRALASVESGTSPEWAADISPLEALGSCDAGVVVFDAREPPLEKYWEEYELLSRRGVPIVGLLNCAESAGGMAERWEDELRREGLSAIVRYDAWAASEADAQRLFDKVRELVRGEVSEAVALIQRRRRDDEREAVDRTAGALAELLGSMAAFRRVVDRGRAGDDAAMRRGFALGWSRFSDRVAAAWGLGPRQIRTLEAELSLVERGVPAWRAARLAGIGGTAGAVGGGVMGAAAHGLAIDAVSGGMTLGLGALGGAVLGGAVAVRRQVGVLARRARGLEEQRFSEAALAETMRRGVWLGRRVRRFGAASERPLDSGTAGAGGEDPRFAVARKRLARIRAATPSEGAELPAVQTDSPRVVALHRALRPLLETGSDDQRGPG
jgi:GTPase SAR1 family protein